MLTLVADRMTERSNRVHNVMAVARALVALGGSATPQEVYDWVTRNGLRRQQAPPDGVDAEEHYEREIRFARQELRYGGLLVSVNKERWQVTDVDGIVALTPYAVQEMIKWNRRHRRRPGPASASEASGGVEERPARPPTATTGPLPTEWSAEASRIDGPAATYALRFGRTDLWKIGFASSVRSRVADINRHIPVELIDGRWELAHAFSWPNQLAAYSMEQEVLAILSSERTVFERVRCSPDRLIAAWDQARDAIGRQQPSPGPGASGGPRFSTKSPSKASRRPTTL